MARILLVDSDSHIFKMMRFRLRNATHDVVWAPNGRLAIEATLEHKPDLVLLELDLPVLDGFQVMEILSARDDTRRIPVIVLSARTHESDVVSAFRAGADDYVTKPFSFPELVARIDRSLRRAARA